MQTHLCVSLKYIEIMAMAFTLQRIREEFLDLVTLGKIMTNTSPCLHSPIECQTGGIGNHIAESVGISLGPWVSSGSGSHGAGLFSPADVRSFKVLLGFASEGFCQRPCNMPHCKRV